MWKEWLDNPKFFVKWYLEHYYKCENGSMHVDKNLFGDESSMYHPNLCCILPHGLNTLITNCKKYYKKGETLENVLPLGVRYNGKTRKYFAEIQFIGAEKVILLSEWKTAQELFAEYKL